MTTNIINSIYAVRIPAVFHTLLDDTTVNITEDTFVDFETLSQRLSIDDVFKFIYEQSLDNGFNDFVASHKLTSIVHRVENVKWLEEHLAAYTAYVKKQEEMKRIKNLPEHWAEDVCKTHVIIRTPNTLNNRTLVFKTRAATSEYRPLVFRRNLADIVYDFLGFDNFRTHPLIKYILRT